MLWIISRELRIFKNVKNNYLKNDLPIKTYSTEFDSNKVFDLFFDIITQSYLCLQVRDDQGKKR